jgi:DNA-binding NtrC family response regulator
MEHFLEKMNARRPQGPVRLSEAAQVQLWEYDWPGNVRELENVIEQLAYENQLIQEALQKSGGNKQAAARLLGLKRTTLVAKLRRRSTSPVQQLASWDRAS